MFNFIWKHFPVFYTLPFLMATIRIAPFETLGLILRWGILAVGMSYAIGISSGNKLTGGKRYSLTVADYITIAFLGIFLLSAIWSIKPFYTVQRAISLILLYITSFFALWKYADCFSENVLIGKILKTLAVVLGINLAIGFFLPFATLEGRFRGIFVNPNNIGLLMSVAFPLAASRWLGTRKRTDLITVTIFGLNLIACGSRSSMLSIAAAMIAILISFTAKRPTQAFFLILISIIGVVAFTQTDFFVNQIVRGDTLTTASNRVYFWELGKKYIANRPDFGHGFGTDIIIHDHYGVELVDLKLRGAAVMSSYYGLAVQMGWAVTYVFFGLLWLFVLRYLITQWQNYQLVVLVATLASGLIVCIYEPAITSAGNIFSFLFWLVFMLSIRRLCYQKRWFIWI